MLITTVGAFLNTPPAPPPICTASLDIAPKASRPKNSANIHNSPLRICSRHSKRRNSHIAGATSGGLLLQAELAEIHVLPARVESPEAIDRAGFGTPLVPRLARKAIGAGKSG